MYHENFLEAYLNDWAILPTQVRYHNDLIDHVLRNEEIFLEKECDGLTNEAAIMIESADKNVVRVYNEYQLLKAYVLENPGLMKYDTSFKVRKRPNGSSRIASVISYDQEEMALQSLFMPFFILKEILTGQTMMPTFPYHATIKLQAKKQTKSTLSLEFDHQKGQIEYGLTIQCATKAIFYHALGLAIGHGSYFDQLEIESQLAKNLKYFDEK